MKHRYFPRKIEVTHANANPFKDLRIYFSIGFRDNFILNGFLWIFGANIYIGMNISATDNKWIPFLAWKFKWDIIGDYWNHFDQYADNSILKINTFQSDLHLFFSGVLLGATLIAAAPGNYHREFHLTSSETFLQFWIIDLWEKIALTCNNWRLKKVTNKCNLASEFFAQVEKLCPFENEMQF